MRRTRCPINSKSMSRTRCPRAVTVPKSVRYLTSFSKGWMHSDPANYVGERYERIFVFSIVLITITSFIQQHVFVVLLVEFAVSAFFSNPSVHEHRHSSLCIPSITNSVPSSNLQPS
ncbi:hypothetical protein BDR04DRAFT_671482 [Suillus decipiens]|nr:hypothetical protein BDR04DRAFT_671482 [Suillus decipiens]